jgi:hypothetical protein
MWPSKFQTCVTFLAKLGRQQAKLSLIITTEMFGTLDKAYSITGNIEG